MFILWCGNLPILEYNGGIVLSRHRNGNNMPKKILEEFKTMATKHGISWNEMCVNDNENCQYLKLE